MNERALMDEALALALKLSPKERIRLIERVASSVEIDIDEPEPEQTLKTGAELAAMLAQMEPIEFIDPEITDPVEWVEAQRRKDAERLKPFWEGKQ